MKSFFNFGIVFYSKFLDVRGFQNATLDFDLFINLHINDRFAKPPLIMNFELLIFIDPVLDKTHEVVLSLWLFPLFIDVIDFAVKWLGSKDADLILILLVVEKNIFIVEVKT